jgi:hypothetical protein
MNRHQFTTAYRNVRIWHRETRQYSTTGEYTPTAWRAFNAVKASAWNVANDCYLARRFHESRKHLPMTLRLRRIELGYDTVSQALAIAKGEL